MSPLLIALLWPVADALPPAIRRQLSPDRALPTVQVQGVNRKALQQAHPAEKGAPVRYAVAQAVSVDVVERASWETLPDGRRVGRLRVHAPGARNLSFHLGTATLPEGVEVWLHAADGLDRRARPMTAREARRGELWTPVVRGDDAVISVVAPPLTPPPALVLDRVHAGFRALGEVRLMQGGCNIDTVCPEADPWAPEVASVAMYGMYGEYWCSGFLMNSARGDRTPYFATANHCDIRSSNDGSLVVYWNYESPVCGALSGGTLDDWQSGSTLRMRDSDTDWLLVELDDPPDDAFEVAWAGWDRADVAPAAATAIHHPGTDEKAISFELDPTTITWPYDDRENAAATHIRIDDWDSGTTEGGSSGSPLFNPDHRAVGVLTGGDAACGNDDPDWYGRMASAWQAGPADDRRLDVWLDPDSAGVTTTDTVAPWLDGVVLRAATTWALTGSQGGPFEPDELVVSAFNFSEADATVNATPSVDWIAAAPVTVAPQAEGALTLRVTDAANALPVGVHTGSVVVTADLDGAGAAEVAVTLIVGEPLVRYAWDLDDDPGWEAEGDWAWGVPAGGGGSDGARDPTSGATGDHVYGYNLNGDYGNDAGPRHLTLGPIDLREQVGTALQFQRWLGVEEGQYDRARISVSTDGVSWTSVWDNPDYVEVDDGAWVPVRYELTALDGAAQAWIRWTMGGTDESVRYCGWNLDDIEISGVPTGSWTPDEPTDTAAPGDSGEPEQGPEDTGSGGPGIDPADPRNKGAQPEVTACGCAAGAPATSGGALLIGLAALASRRRRR